MNNYLNEKTRDGKMAHVHIIKTKLNSDAEVEAFSSKNKALKKYKDYIIEYSGQSNCKVTIQEESFKAVIDGSKNENIFSAEYMRIVIR